MVFVKKTVSEEKYSKDFAIPDKEFPSDHVPIAVVLEIFDDQNSEENDLAALPNIWKPVTTFE